MMLPVVATALLTVKSIAAFPTTPDVPSQSAIVDLGYAKYQGVTLEAGVNQYLGIRYAAPPLGDLRWRAPRDPDPLSGVQDASKYGPICLGQQGFEAFGISSGDSEDCLTLDIYAPADATPDSKLPVWFFIPGGGYAINANFRYNATEVIERSGNSIVYVYVNYRVGVYGFLASEKIRENGDLNAGLLDQVKALEWLQKYISLFGGDPDHVVMQGVSAGAGSVAHHLAAHGGRDDHLFHGVIAQSPFWPSLFSVEEVEFSFDAFAANVSCDNAEDVLTCLRSLDTATLQASDQRIPFPGLSGSPIWQYLPVIDGELVTDQLYNSFDQGRIIHVPAMVGNDANEGAYFGANASTPEEFLSFIQDNYPTLTPDDLVAINATYPPEPPLPAHAAWFPNAAAAYGDASIYCPGKEMATTMAQCIGPDFVWNWHTEIIDQMNLALGWGVPHTFETTAIFGPNQAGPCDSCSFETYNAAIVPVVMDYWISFIKTLNPNPFKSQTAPQWQPWGRNGEKGQRLRFQTNNTAMETVPESDISVCQFWKELAVTMEQ